MHEIIVNLHMHTRYSDGSGTHKDIAQAAMKAGLDAVIVTDHNVLVQGVEGYYRRGSSRVLLLVGQEVHDQALEPQKNHLLVFNANRDVATFAHDPQRLVEAVREAEGMSFIAHPSDPAAPVFGETDISWERWDVTGFQRARAMERVKRTQSISQKQAAWHFLCVSSPVHWARPAPGSALKMGRVAGRRKTDCRDRRIGCARLAAEHGPTQARHLPLQFPLQDD